MSYERATRLFSYENDTLIWKNPKQSSKKGQPVGRLENGTQWVQWVVTIGTIRYRLANIIYTLHTKSTPKYIEFIDGNPLNVKFKNLKPTTMSAIQKRRKRHA